MSKSLVSTNVDNHEKIEKEYSNFCQYHVDCLVKNIIENEDVMSEEITLLGLSEGATALFFSNLQIGIPEDKGQELCKSVLKSIEEQDDRIASLALIAKLCTEMLSKIHVSISK